MKQGSVPSSQRKPFQPFTSSSQMVPQQDPTTSANTSVSIPSGVTRPMLSHDQVGHMLASIAGPHERLDPCLVPILSRIADEWVEDLTKACVGLASLRLPLPGPVSQYPPPQHNSEIENEQSVEVTTADVRLILERTYGMTSIIGLPDTNLEERGARLKRTLRAKTGTDLHRSRMQVVKKAQGKQ